MDWRLMEPEMPEIAAENVDAVLTRQVKGKKAQKKGTQRWKYFVLYFVVGWIVFKFAGNWAHDDIILSFDGNMMVDIPDSQIHSVGLVDSCEVATKIRSSNRLAAMTVWHTWKHINDTDDIFCAIEAWGASFFVHGMNTEIDRVLLLSGHIVRYIEVFRNLRAITGENLFTHVFATTLRTVERQQVYYIRESPRKKFTIDAEIYGQLLKLYASGLTSYEGVFFMDMDAWPDFNFLHEMRNLLNSYPSKNLFHTSNERSPVIGAAYVVRPLLEDCVAMEDAIKRADWTPYSGFGGNPSNHTIWKGFDPSDLPPCANYLTREQRLVLRSESQTKGTVYRGCIEEFGDQGLLWHAYHMLHERSRAMTLWTEEENLFDFFHCCPRDTKPWQEKRLQQLLEEDRGSLEFARALKKLELIKRFSHKFCKLSRLRL
uniref:Uncharacterized protein n=1 Tax=Mucochytrium quahogii TaxID=96639 RepID=A0A7S2RI57_9STRA|mmetsp:Transcript_17823/g.28859  ORF Transcript_17823/g.28859 Transcript_17823/m.28859 type:complete len:429 (+) Transcript_17823:340-1626(+)|eukprot:CAMPEP_0203760380 /NCGR_PEP_ID=MMETSP0098-20131031/13683_1 /ASSEMBLY_ACC=CAM_ASM_000208 /TAXON_ID=96639 /ORGANISM=" , Strain NY0313808BC1" /LENGTH=428 /DNA_ID=CAMNT_0050653907 /DNA_START=336 /DNA_END=1622 /DNA_ORIENTATION=+